MTLDGPDTGLPGEVSIRKGFEDFAAGRSTLEALLVQVASFRLRRAGLPLPGPIDPDADYKLFELLREMHGESALSQYNAWIRQLVSFERALEHRRRREQTVDRGAGV